MESPYTILLTGAFFAGMCIVAWFQNGRREPLYAFLGVVAATLLLWGVERKWVTEREAVVATIHQIARDIESNDFRRMEPHFHSSAEEIRDRARAEVGNYDFKSISVKNNIEVEVDMKHQPPKAVAQFNVVGVLAVRSFGNTERTIPRYIELFFYKDKTDGKWKIADYGHRSAIPGQHDIYERRLGEH